MLVTEQNVKEDENGADENSGIGDVKGGVAVGAKPDFEEIRHCAVEDPIGDVAGSAAEQESDTSDGFSAAALTGD